MVICDKRYKFFLEHDKHILKGKNQTKGDIEFARGLNLISSSISLIALIPGYYVFRFIYNKIHKQILKNLQINELKDFIQNWNVNKLQTPEDFREDFEQLYQEYIKTNALDFNKIFSYLKLNIKYK